ncbi:uncharacterized protein LOC121811115 [Salvia splendens]|uniref:uncharacterized protein LOC121811115 n=1 Tax=Salvia splendens TaxID=180675 RepID=UPI001C2729E2|nr:uncharacterized protein LOC121811115 [Salvia splendens]
MGHQEYSSEFKNQVVQFIIGRCVGGVPPRDTLKGGTTEVYNLPANLYKMVQCCKETTTKRNISSIGCSKTTVWRWVKDGLIIPHTSAIKPNLIAANKLLRLRFTVESLELDRILNKIRFRNMHNTTHIDEKWFYMTKGAQRFYLAPGEQEPHRTFCRPLFGVHGEVLFDGKIGIFLFTKHVAAKRSSKNRQAGTMETKPIESITKDVGRDCLINKILPAIIAKWPDGATKVLKIQQDNADHTSKTMIQFSEKLHNKVTACKNVDDLVNAVEKSFHELQPETLDNVFLSLQGCYMEIMKVQGQNSYKLPHMGKTHLRRTNQLPLNLEVPVEQVT